ncbi:RimJ/RimL family protein N-acetyltransferase [Nocardioides marinisabuli]|uniref:RimJ/RimL family protein N-acetyltransferase n=1 Tax=Nocardioides marinisabuli TaxID=419476 RepID=A0A7Y9JSH0_9ACTN|nr:GNAT family N-acetyltransferase [Nocardioides marinisabuli]NYD59316.1 RimJ/RimL family protein N-acetyltransferase [Nocardioides marinisabuli]
MSLADVWPIFGLEVTVGDLSLRLPRDEEVAALARLAGDGVHRPDERPFLTPWTEGGPEARARFVLREHWSALASWEPYDWRLGLAVFADGEPVGSITLRARDLAVLGEVSTFSWLGLAHHGRGIGTRARAGVLSLAFDHLGARSATSEVFPDNHASQGVSRQLGYEPDGVSWGVRGDEALLSDRLRLVRERWAGAPEPVDVRGLDACRSYFG